ncbi:MAG: ABC transporter substrate-binding protein [Aromatoleum sp.]|jgi:ABC transporter substrate binding protein (PQQ-dependent alcohol dehydrogenase system)|uniref:ABC transporter substrate-binding protein n=1 Tax=Aromatoleum sp. TaxID=2307007 RepID=UPI002893E582|nr:ABC transporter substrate-binding protein [Aromatoleum sp.]MDT3669364.1 ABC transporter substrate-binding protein [Aromatoleum sp.]
MQPTTLARRFFSGPFGRRLAGLFLALGVATAASAATTRIAVLEVEPDARYDETRLFFRGLAQPLGRPFAGAEVALREARFVGQAVGTEFALERVSGGDASALVAAVERLAKDGVRFFLIDAPAPVVADVSKAVRGRELLLFNVSAPDDALRQEQCQPNLLHTLPNDAMRADALAQFLVSKKWRSVLLLEGPKPEDRLLAAAFERSAKRFGLKIAERRPFVLSNDPRQRDQGNVALLTAGPDHDVVFVADSDGEFARSVPYRTVRPRPVVGSEGLVATAWHWSWERHGAPQLNARLEKQAARRMAAPDWAAWMAVKTVVEAVVRTQNAPFPALAKYIKGEDITLDGFKGSRLGFRPWDNQLRQPMLLATHNAVIERAPIAGFLHPTQNLDTLGFDRRDSRCAF